MNSLFLVEPHINFHLYFYWYFPLNLKLSTNVTLADLIQKPCQQTEKGRNNTSACILPSSVVTVQFTASAPGDENSASCWYRALGPLLEATPQPCSSRVALCSTWPMCLLGKDKKGSCNLSRVDSTTCLFPVEEKAVEYYFASDAR